MATFPVGLRIVRVPRCTRSVAWFALSWINEAEANGPDGFIDAAIRRRKDRDGSGEFATTPTTGPSRRSKSTGAEPRAEAVRLVCKEVRCCWLWL